MFKIAGKTINHLTHDSRTVQNGSCFFVLNPDSPSTRNHICQAVANGAVLLIAERDLGESIPTLVVQNIRKSMSLAAKRFNNDVCDKMKIIAVVGTNGKTTTTHIMKHILRDNVATIGTLGPGSLTTPDPIELHEIFSQMYNDGIRTICMEVSAHAIHYHKVFGISFKAAIFTNISQDHLDFFNTYEDYANTKMNFFSDYQIQYAIFNADNEFGSMIEKKCFMRSHLESYSISEIENLQLSLHGSTFMYKKQKFHINLPARFNVYNALACIKTARVLGIPWRQIRDALSSLPQIRGRFNVIPFKNDSSIVIDFAHTPDGLEKLLTSIRNLAPSHYITTVFGCGGNRDKSKREIMGKIAAHLSDKIIITSDNPRYESPRAIILQIEQGVKTAEHKNYTMMENRREAIRSAIDYMQAEEVVVIAGRGGETHQEINGRLVEFCDEQVVKEYIKQSYTTQNRM